MPRSFRNWNPCCSLKLLVERADTRENIKVHFLNVTQEELLDDFEFAPEITQSAYYKHVYSSGYGQFGGEPVAAVIGSFAFKNTTPDMKLLKYISGQRDGAQPVPVVSIIRIFRSGFMDRVTGDQRTGCHL